ncbi:Disease resistance protein (NBS-LRR class) family [Raphanus sativus]|uniref:Probable disease resistance protein At1g61300 n=1 Tax=Raphanus sativus TaxID=3726 RepID=A0A9W3C904_RAPSA|nr:probable disease resistance protein At1g61300 [Raphanus sativus]XP_056856390.1 probable disease resistance protein At1g61300 [Raphanus sativus]KAJ4867664.1 Disease resistance protein (NBS-LRR class) family [Raphanus sativus]KAJ4879061.1 Disease resistance protein (NBS-LRR class) family [Raphanus sativus]
MGNVTSALSRGFQAAKNFKYILELEDHLESLQEVALLLEAEKVVLQSELGLRVEEKFKVWISEVEAIEPKVAKLLEDRTAEIERLSMCGCCSSNFFLTNRYGKDVFETLEKAQRVLSSKPSGEVARMDPSIEERATVGLENMLEATWSRLMEKEVGILGLYGMGGIGKTTLLKQVNEKLLEEKNEFEVVIFVVASQNLQVGKIQNEIGERLCTCGMSHEWEKKTQKEKASSIYDVLTRRRFVLLLDDVWRKVDLEEEIGIPLPTPENGSKVVFTTRSKYVCERMGPHDLEVKKLDPENAWELFRQKVGGRTVDNDPKILELAGKVCEKCKGIPLALNVIGETMSYQTSVRRWQRAIVDLDSNAANYPEVKDEILKILKVSYDGLGEAEQQCFQYCALFPEDDEINKDMLVEYWIHEGIINEGGDREMAAFNKGSWVINILLGACLLMPTGTSDSVKMHDVTREMALWAASNFGEEEENFIVKAGAGLQQMPEVRNWNAVRRMSLANNEIQNISISPDCPNLTTLLLKDNNLVNISGEFFLSMPKLMVLDLSSNQNLTKLPEEVSNLVSLRYLDLSGTSLENLPVGLGKLIQLRYLNLTGVRTLQSFSVISSLVNIEMLLLDDTTLVSLELIEDIKLLEKLKSLGVSISDLVVLERLLSIPKLARCIENISLEGVVSKDGPLQLEKAMGNLRYIGIERCIISDIMEHKRYGRSSTCFENLVFVNFYEVSGVQDLSWLLFAPNLSFLSVKGPSRELQEIVSREKVSGILNEESRIAPFGKLQSIILLNLEELKSIYWERLELPRLKSMDIAYCPKLKRLPLSKERAYNFDLHEYGEEWFGGLEWEDEATED